MCKYIRCTPDNPCKWCLRRADAKTRKHLKRTEIKKSGKPIRKRSEKRGKQEREYNKRIKEWKKENRCCQASLSGCTGLTQDVHHMRSRTNDNLLNEDEWLAVCRSCHSWITDNSNRAIAMGLSLRRNVSIEQRKAE